MRIHLGADDFVARWVADHIPHMKDGTFGPCVGIAILSSAGEMMGGVVFHDYRPQVRSIEMSAASVSRRWVTRSIISGVLAYPFEQLKCRRITTITPRRNKAARTFDTGIGFKQEGLVRRGFGNDDAVIYGLLANEWRRGKFCLLDKGLAA